MSDSDWEGFDALWRIHNEVEALMPRLVEGTTGEFGTARGPSLPILAWSHAGRIRNDAAFASLAGVAPIPASSGQTVRHRLNRGSDRQLNRALHTIVVSRLVCHDETKAYAARRLAEGKTTREVRRCLKRHLARRVFKLLEHTLYIYRSIIAERLGGAATRLGERPWRQGRG